MGKHNISCLEILKHAVSNRYIKTITSHGQFFSSLENYCTGFVSEIKEGGREIHSIFNSGKNDQLFCIMINIFAPTSHFDFVLSDNFSHGCRGTYTLC